MLRFARVLASLFAGLGAGILGIALVGTSSAAQNASTSRPIAVVVSGGATVPMSGFKDYNDLGVHADVSLLVRLAGQSFRLRPEFTYGRFSLKDPSPSLSLTAHTASNAGGSGAVASMLASNVIPGYGAGTGDASTLLGLLGNVELPLSSGFYVIVGVGATNVRSGATTATDDVSLTGLTYNGGAGLRFHLGAISGFVEGRLKSISVEKGRALFSDVRTLPVTFGLVF